MRKSDALRLKTGDRIMYGSGWRTEDWHKRGGWYRTGTVLVVTPRGGVRVHRDDRGGIEWVPYHHIGQHGPDVPVYSRD